MRDDERAAIAEEAPEILTRVGVDPDASIDRMARHRPAFVRAMGRADRLRRAAPALGRRVSKG